MKELLPVGCHHHGIWSEPASVWLQQTPCAVLRGTDAMPRICSDRYSKAGPHRGDTFGRSCAALPLRNVPVLLHSLPGRNDTVRLGLSALLEQVPELFGRCMFLPGDQPLFVPRDSGSHGRHLRMGSRRARLERQKKQNGRSSVWDSGSVTTRLPLLEVPFCLKKDFFRNCSPCRRAWAEAFCFGNIPRMFTPFTLRIGMNWPTPTRPEALAQLEALARQKLFELYSALSSFGSSTFSRIATKAAGTMPDSPQISWKRAEPVPECRCWHPCRSRHPEQPTRWSDYAASSPPW